MNCGTVGFLHKLCARWQFLLLKHSILSTAIARLDAINTVMQRQTITAVEMLAKGCLKDIILALKLKKIISSEPLHLWGSHWLL